MPSATTGRATALTALLTLCACGQQPAPADPILVIDPDDMAPDHAHHHPDAAPDLAPADMPDLAPDMPDMGAEDMAPDLMTYPSTLPPVLGLTTLPDLHPDPHIVEVRLTVQEAEQQIVQGAKTKLLTYNGLMPGPLIHAKVGDRLIIHVQNDLDEDTLIHWHGLRISDQMDGSPVLQRPIKSKQSFTYDFVVPDAGTFWYHTHLHQIEQLERGLYGGLVVHEATPPAFQQEHLLILDDMRLDLQNQISPFLTSGPDIGRGRVGNNLLVNGQTSVVTWELPRGAVQRWRVVSAHNALSYGLRIQGAKDARHRHGWRAAAAAAPA